MPRKTRNQGVLPLLLLLSWATYVTAYLCRINLSAALEKLAAGLDVSVEYLGIASSVYFVTYAVGQLLNGAIGDRVDPYRFLMLALSLTGGVNMILGVQASGAAFLLLWGLNGFCQSMFWGTLLRLLSARAPEEQWKNVSTVMSTCSVTGYFLSWVVLSALFLSLDHRPYFLVPGAAALLLVPAWFALSRRFPFTPPAEGPPQAEGLPQAEDRSPAENPPPAPPLGQVAHAFWRERLIFICLLCALVGAIQEGAAFWMPMIFTSVLDLGGGSLLLLMLIPLARLAGVFLARWILSAMKDRADRAMLAAMSLACLIAGVLIWTSGRPGPLTAVLIACLISVIYTGNWYTINYLPLYFASRGMVATLVGAFDFSTYIGAAMMSGSLGILMLRHGWGVLPVLWLALSAAAAALTLGGAGKCLARKGAPL